MIVKVNLWSKLIGAIMMDAVSNTAIFEYDKKFLKSGLEVSPLLMPLTSASGKVWNFNNMSATFLGLPPMIADSLPDDFGNRIMNEWLNKQGKTINDLTIVERLTYIGKRGMGALEFEPVVESLSIKSTNIDVSELITVVNKVLNSKKKLHESELNEQALSNLIRIGTSAGGMRAKAVIAIDEKTGEIKAGDILHSQNHSYWLLKLDGVSDKLLGDPEGYGKMEYVYYQMAKLAGINMTESKLFSESGRHHFMTKRFDRTEENGKLHMQTLGGIAGMDYKQPMKYSYEQVFAIMRKLQLNYSDADQQYRRMLFNVIARNQDDHVKNISFLMDKEGRWCLSPAYDLSYSYNPDGIWTNKHQLSINGKRDSFSINDLLNLGKELNIKHRKMILENVTEAVNQWSQLAKEVDIPKNQILNISKMHRLNIN